MWDDAQACNTLLSARKSAHKALIEAVRQLNEALNQKEILPKKLRRKLLILSLLIAYLEQREVFVDGYFAQFLSGATKFFEVLANGNALLNLLSDLEERFNGHVFSLSVKDREQLEATQQLSRFSKLIEAREEQGGQLSLWKLYSFKDLPVELISHVYQLFVKDNDVSIYTPPFLVKLILQETLSWERLDRISERKEVILDPACGSGAFLVEAYKRLVLHWRIRNQWEKPGVIILKSLLTQIHGIDLEEGAIELAAFSLCLALCDALEPEEIRSSIKLFPQLAGITLHHSCFFEAKQKGLVQASVGVVLGNPPFASRIETPSALKSYQQYELTHDTLPDKQIAYLFLHEAMEMLVQGGILSMLQQYNFLYNQKSLSFRRNFISEWDVREILDFISVRGLFQKGEADTKVVVVVAEANIPPVDRKILHATFRRSGRTDAEQGFDIDYYDLHWISRHLALSNDSVWRTNLFGGGRALGLVDQLRKLPTLKQYALNHSWDFGEGFIEGKTVKRQEAAHLTGKPYLPSTGLMDGGPDIQKITTVKATMFKSAYKASRYTAPMLLIRAHMELANHVFADGYLTYSQRVIGFCAPVNDHLKLQKISIELKSNIRLFQAYLALISPSLFIQKATVLQADDIYSLPYTEGKTLEISPNEYIIAEDIVNYYREMIRLGDSSSAMKESAEESLPAFNKIFTAQINATYKANPIKALKIQCWPGIICQPYVFGDGEVEWGTPEELKIKVNSLLYESQGTSLNVTRICRLYDDKYLFVIKPNRLRYWMRSVALRDADEILADLRAQGF